MKKRAALCAVLLGVTMTMAGCSTGGPIENDYIKITKYKGVEVPAVEGYSEITDEAVEKRIAEVMEGFAEYTEITDRPVQDGDTVFIDYTGTVDGEVLENETGTDYQVVVGNKSLYAEFDNDVIGKNVGDSFVTTKEFSKDYVDASLAGKEMNLTITVKRIFEKELPELTDEFVQTVSQESKTVEEYREEVKELMEEAVEKRIAEVMEGFAEYTEVTDRPVQEGDTIFVDYTAEVDGVVLDAESGTDYQVVVGNKSLYDEFDRDVIGKNIGDSFVTTKTFSNEYADATLAGKTMDLTITVKRIFEKELPELTEEFVQTVSQESETVEEYRAEVKALMEEAVEEAVEAELVETVWEAVLTNSEIKEYPADRLEAEIDELYAYYQKGAEVYEMEFDVFLDEVMGLTEEQFVANLQIAAETNLKNDLIVELICEKEKISLTEEEMLEAQEELAKEMGYAGVTEMLEDAGEEAVKSYIMRDIVKEWLVDNCIQVND